MLDDLFSIRPSRFRLAPRTIIALYVLFGGAWIIATAIVLLNISYDVSSLVYLDILEELAFIVLTALPLYLLINHSERQIRQSIQQYRELIEFLPIAIGVYSQGRLLYANAEGLKFLKKSSSREIAGVPLFDIITTENMSTSQMRIDQVVQGQPVPFEERQISLADGSIMVAEVAGLPFPQAGKGATLLVAHDITTRKQLENEQIRMNEQLEQRVQDRTYELARRQRVAEGLSDIIAKLNSNASLDEIMEFVVAQMCPILGSTASAIYRLDSTTNILRIQTAVGLPQAFVNRVQVPMGHAVVGKAVDLRQPVVLANIKHIATQTTLNDDLLALVQVLEHDFQSVLAVPLVVKDILYGGLVLYFPDERSFSPGEIEIATIFGGQIALAIENARLVDETEKNAALAERNRLAHDLHDSVSQVLFSASLIAEVLPIIWEIDQTEGLLRLHELRQLTRGALAEMRTLLHELRPAALEESPLPELLRHLAEATMGRASIPVELVIEGDAALPAQTRVALYRITQQALDNIWRHARATRAEVRLYAREGSVALQISDDGRGFDPAHVPPGHLGLKIMRERAEATGATLDIQSNPGGGTRISVQCIIGDSEVCHD